MKISLIWWLGNCLTNRRQILTLVYSAPVKTYHITKHVNFTQFVRSVKCIARTKRNEMQWVKAQGRVYAQKKKKKE